MYSNLKIINGFTLAEILITFGVIGVIVAITLATLIHQYQMKVFETAFKKVYSTLQNTINYVTTTENLTECYLYHDYQNNLYNTSHLDCKQLKNSIISNLKLTKINNDFSNLYALKNDVISKGGESINGSVHYDIIIKNSNSYLLKDGTVIFFEEAGINRYSQAIIIFDVNGKKGPNKWGYDLFWMNLTKHNSGKIMLTGQLAGLKEKGGKYPRDILRGTINDN